jgi:hypothetical protein
LAALLLPVKGATRPGCHTVTHILGLFRTAEAILLAAERSTD